jgi:hypothetical protein
MPRKIIIDCDPGHDDAMAILLAHGNPEIELCAITTVAGNQTLEKTTLNARRVCSVANITGVPVAAGCDRPLLRPLVTAAETHGESGLDGPRFEGPTTPLADSHAVDLIIDLPARPRPVRRRPRHRPQAGRMRPYLRHRRDARDHNQRHDLGGLREPLRPRAQRARGDKARLRRLLEPDAGRHPANQLTDLSSRTRRLARAPQARSAEWLRSAAEHGWLRSSLVAARRPCVTGCHPDVAE